MLQYEHGSVTSRPYRRLRLTDQPTNQRTSQPSDQPTNKQTHQRTDMSDRRKVYVLPITDLMLCFLSSET